MKNDDVLRQLCSALDLTDADVARIFAGMNEEMPGEAAEPGTDRSDHRLRVFLDGLILDRRGPPKNPRPEAPDAAPPRLTNNLLLKKLRIALNLVESDLLEVFAAGGLKLTGRELTPWFRRPGSTHFKKCGDDVLQAFLTGLARREG